MAYEQATIGAMKIDSIDRRIIDALCGDAQIPLAELADRIGSSRQAVRH
ncbi:AsnC family transcriptional regulator [Burkholderia sp. Ax-1719]|nr:AsnC family transcriptional regulator [Burkholderia sp. Ax-1719]